MKIGITLSLFTLLFLIGACNGSKKTTETTTPVPTENPEDRMQEGPGKLLISMNKSACFGTCPVYNLSVYNNGRVEYEGLRHTEKPGLHSRVLESEVYSKLVRECKGANLEQYEEEYFSGATDFPITTISYHAQDSVKNIRGDFKRPKAVQLLEKQLIAIADTGIWIQEEVLVPYGAISNELIVELEEGMDGVRWVASYPDYALEVVRRIAPNLPLWLIRFEEAKVKPGRMVVLLREKEEVKKVEFNKKLEQRN